MALTTAPLVPLTPTPYVALPLPVHYRRRIELRAILTMAVLAGIRYVGRPETTTLLKQKLIPLRSVLTVTHPEFKTRVTNVLLLLPHTLLATRWPTGILKQAYPPSPRTPTLVTGVQESTLPPLNTILTANDEPLVPACIYLSNARLATELIPSNGADVTAPQRPNDPELSRVNAAIRATPQHVLESAAPDPGVA